MTYKIAAFIITFERPSVVLQTIQTLMGQSCPPEKILIVDNSISNTTFESVSKSNFKQLEYFRPGCNIGPAGAAKIGLEKLANEGYEWIYWGDDDDPPKWTDTFEILLKTVKDSSSQNIGIVGAVGQYFNPNLGKIVRVPDRLLHEEKVIEVGSIAGGQSMIVNANLIRSGVCPNERLFFGFEELDFCIRANSSGYKLVVPTELFLRAREKYGRLNFEKKLYHKKSLESLKRQYYSTRNLLSILWENSMYTGFFFQLFTALVKSLYGFRYGWQYGSINARYLLSGIFDFMAGRLGKVH